MSLGLGLLWRHVAPCANHSGGLCHSVSYFGLGEFCEPEICHLGMALLVEENVGRLDVTVDVSGLGVLVDVLQSSCSVQCNLHPRWPREGRPAS
jgi:hypothetical protein